ncbi:MFS transporter [Aciduricibacillus chroicocephali]|uniref:MFS transporter n=1 Tax=Aciduricibacillus chroicocephali TaxID=3054939 RepID=A0ABY9KT76_9BACI|nr:MFS transporter [Bacillaceae bacterium 44XB]
MEKQNKLLVDEKDLKVYQFVLIIGIILAASNMRPAITAVGPLLQTIGADYGLAHWMAGLLTTLPLLAFAFLSPLAPQVGVRLTNELAIVAGMLMLICGMLLRSVSLLSFLFLGTLIAGAGIAIMNVLIPGVIKHKFPLKVGLMTGVYSTTMSGVSGISSGLSVPFAKGLGWGWKWALVIWVIPAIVGLAVWIFLAIKENRRNHLTKSQRKHKAEEQKPDYIDDRRIWKSGLAWQMSFFMALQAFLFYVTITWLPAILESNGYTESGAGWMLSFMQFIGLPASFIVPVLADRVKSQSALAVGLCVAMFVGYLTLLLGHSHIVMIIGTAIIGLSVNGNFSLALAFFGLRAKTGKDAAELSGMAQSLGYLLSAFGPTLLGLLYDKTQTWSAPLYVILAVVLVLSILGALVGRNRYVFDDKKKLNKSAL